MLCLLRQACEKDKQAVDQDKPAPKKAGRPVEYQGDINSPALSTSERCRIKRRIVNREAARRLRERRQETLDSAQDKVSHIAGLARSGLCCDWIPHIIC